MNTQSIKVENFYKTTLTEDINDLGDIDFTVATPPVNPKGFITINPGSSSLRESFFYSDVSGNRVYVKGANRSNPKTHSTTDEVQINDDAGLFNFISSMAATTFFCEKIASLGVRVWGGPVLKDNTEVDVADTELTLTNNATNYICYDHENNVVTAETAETGIVVAVITTASGIITNISYRHHKITLIGTIQGPPGPAGSAVELPENESESNEYCDNIQPPILAVISNPNPSSVKITELDGAYQSYSTTAIGYVGADGGIKLYKAVTGVVNAGYIEYATEGFKVNLTTGVIVTCYGNVAYTNLQNIITGNNLFKGDVVFQGQAVFAYHVNATGEDIFDASLGTKQGFNFDSGNVTMDFTNLLDGNTLLFAVTVNTSTVNLSFGTATKKNGTTYPGGFYSIGGDTYPLALDTGTHLLAAEVFSSAVHISYLGKSTVI